MSSTLRRRNQSKQEEGDGDGGVDVDDDDLDYGNGTSSPIATTTMSVEKDDIIVITPEEDAWGTQGPSRIVRKLAMYRVVLFGILVRVST